MIPHDFSGVQKNFKNLSSSNSFLFDSVRAEREIQTLQSQSGFDPPPPTISDGGLMTSSVKRHGQFTAEPRTVGKFLIMLNGRSFGPDTGKEAPIEIQSVNGKRLKIGNEFKIHERKILIIQKILEIRQSLNHYSEKTKKNEKDKK